MTIPEATAGSRQEIAAGPGAAVAVPSGRPAWLPSPGVLAVAVLTTIVGAAVAVAISPKAWAVDIDRNLAAADALARGSFGMVEGYLYTPLAALLTIPLTLVPAGLAVAAWFVARLGLVLAGAARETRGWMLGDRWAAALAAVMFVPTLHDLMLGNVSIIMTAGIALVLWGRDRWVSGLALGLVLATVPKPQLLPILVWMLVFRRRALGGTLGAAFAASVAGILALGVDRYRTFVDVVLHAPYLGTPMYGNLGLSALTPEVAIPLGVLVVAATAVAFWRGEMPGFICAVAAGILLAPYTMAYSVVPLLLGVRPLADASPRAAFALAITASLGVLVALPLWLGAVMVAAIVLVPRSVGRSSVDAAGRSAVEV
jgi:hypothetical protein